ncbi:MAG: lysophospholipid acyltransferase family protein [Desulfohalobiaceae bacterium]|nr:lysophospholipid acyltransferase family protein [Desulfohalobiaceae bacterium]
MLNIILELLSSFLIRLSPDRIKRIGRTTGRIMWHILPSRRRIATRAIELHLGKDTKQAKALAKSSFRHSGAAFAELFVNRAIDHRFLQERIEIDDPDLLFQALQAQRPLILSTGHLGAWELLSGVFSLIRGEKQCQVVVRYPKSRALSRLLDHFRKHSGMDMVHKDQATKKVLRILKENGLCGFLVDQNCGRSKAVFLPFLKKTAAVNKGPALLALRSRALVLPVFLVRETEGKYRLITRPPLDTLALSGSKEEQVKKTAAFYTRAVEDMVHLYPEQWFWMHRRWKTRPRGEQTEEVRIF